MSKVTDKSTLKALAEKYHLEICLHFRYYEGNAYNNLLGETLPSYFRIKNNIFVLKYESGCFNPYFHYAPNDTYYIRDIKTKEILQSVTENFDNFDKTLYRKCKYYKFNIWDFVY